MCEVKNFHIMNIDVPAGVGASPLYMQLQICTLDHEEGVQMCAPTPVVHLKLYKLVHLLDFGNLHMNLLD